MDQPTTSVLLIEDNPGDADLVRLRLVEGQAPVKVNWVNRLSDGLASLSRETPSLVLLDLNLPDSHGAETFRRLMEHSPNVPVVVLSGQDDEVLATKAVHHGVYRFLVRNLAGMHRLARREASLTKVRTPLNLVLWAQNPMGLS
jgi:DNA-binding response OmpR family regulator